MLEEYAEIYKKLLFGDAAKHVALNYIIQDGDTKDKCLFVGQTTWGKQMAFGGKNTHTLVCCDAIIRPRLVVSSDHLRGIGTTGLLTTGFSPEEIPNWIDNGETILAEKT